MMYEPHAAHFNGARETVEVGMVAILKSLEALLALPCARLARAAKRARLGKFTVVRMPGKSAANGLSAAHDDSS